MILEFIFIAIYVFIIVFLVDVVWVFYVKFISDLNENAASFVAAGIYLLGGMAILSYTSSEIYLLPACIGAYFGTKYAVRLKKYLIKNNIDELSFLTHLLYRIKKFLKRNGTNNNDS